MLLCCLGRQYREKLYSSDGLLITNHHCGYGQIQKHSTLEHDYLTNGFWAMSHEEELPNLVSLLPFLKGWKMLQISIERGN